MAKSQGSNQGLGEKSRHLKIKAGIVTYNSNTYFKLGPDNSSTGL